MSDPYIGEIRLFAFSRVPSFWVACNGQLLSIAQYSALYSLIGTTYGGDGITTFGVPDLRGRVPIGYGQGPGLSSYMLGEMAGTEQVTLTLPQLAVHGHPLTSTTNPATTTLPGTTVHLATATPSTVRAYAPTANVATYELLAAQSVLPTGGNGPHANMMPSLVMNFCMSTEGIYPSN